MSATAHTDLSEAGYPTAAGLEVSHTDTAFDHARAEVYLAELAADIKAEGNPHGDPLHELRAAHARRMAFVSEMAYGETDLAKKSLRDLAAALDGGQVNTPVDVVGSLSTWANEKSIGMTEYFHRSHVCAAVTNLIEAAKPLRSADAALRAWSSTADPDAPAPRELLKMSVSAKHKLFDALAALDGGK